MHRRIVGPEETAVGVGVERILHGHLSEVLVADDPYRQVVPAVLQEAGDVEDRLLVGTGDFAQTLSVQEDFRLPVHAVEMQELALGIDPGLEGVPIPEIGMEIGFGDEELVVGEVRIRYGAHVDIAREDRSGDGGGNPAVGLEIDAGDDLTGFDHFGRPLQAPFPAGQFLPAAGAHGGLLRHDRHAAAAPDFPFGQGERRAVRRPVQSDLEKAGLGFRKLHLGEGLPFRDPGDIFPMNLVLGAQDRPAHRRVPPPEDHPVHPGVGAEIHADPLFGASGADPFAAEQGVSFGDDSIRGELRRLIKITAGRVLGGPAERQVALRVSSRGEPGRPGLVGTPRIDAQPSCLCLRHFLRTAGAEQETNQTTNPNDHTVFHDFTFFYKYRYFLPGRKKRMFPVGVPFVAGNIPIPSEKHPERPLVIIKCMFAKKKKRQSTYQKYVHFYEKNF